MGVAPVRHSNFQRKLPPRFKCQAAVSRRRLFLDVQFVATIHWVQPKLDLNRPLYLQSLRRMAPAQRLAKAMELSDLGKRLFLHGLRKRFVDASEAQIRRIYLERTAKCHNRNY